MSAKKCDVCGGPYPSFHICNPNPDTRVQAPKVRRSERHLQALSEGVSLRWERYREENRKRDEKIVKRYNEGGIGQDELAKQYGISRSTIQKVLKEAEREGLLEMRAPGTTLAKGAK